MAFSVLTVKCLIVRFNYMKLIKCLLLVMIFLTISTQNTFASGFNLLSIGGVNTSGRASGHWWYTSSNPLFKGESLPTEAVDISIDGTTETAPTSSDGTWQYQPTILTDGDHQVILTSGGSTIKFTLTIGADKVDWDTIGKDSGEALPATGVTEMTWILIIAGLAGIGLGGKMVFNAARK